MKISSKTFSSGDLNAAKTLNLGVSKAKGGVSYVLNSKAKPAGIKVSSNGIVTVPSNCAAGTYKITVKAAGNKKYKSSKITVAINVIK